ncbi:MAG: chemotaxis protein CheW [Desulfuromusa sp.]|jgi:purine-binding chemotaxis protein CheW|nr:chemotaxis protein CheW [Desulfuromusa sp.]
MTNAALAIDSVDVQQVEDSQRDLYLTFHLHGEDYGIAINYVTEIIGIQKITNVPDMPDCIKGVINLRGRVIPVMDIRLRFGLPYRDYDERTCVIVVDVNKLTTGLVVDRVKEVVEISAEQIEPAPKHGVECSYIEGMGKIGKNVKILLNIESLISLDKEVMSDVDQTEVA